MTILDELSSSIRAVHEFAAPSTVGVGRRIRGSGVVIGANRVLTNAHNLRGDEVTITFRDGRAARGAVKGVDTDGDLAVIEVDTAGAAALEWAGADPAVGDVVFGLAATGTGPARVTAGTISAIEQAFRGPGGSRIGGSLEHTAPLAPGSSGGPLVDGSGRLVALNTNRVGEGFYLARPADATLRDRVDALGRGEPVARPRLGIAVAPSMVARRLRRSVGLAERDGLLVRGVEDGSPAERAGIREGDLLVEAAGQAIPDPDALNEILASSGLPIEMKIVRGDEERTVSVGGATGASGEA
ncbi:MAG TPA: trypsin-like peptidase domain-containing protein [Candidatus Limnocylindrales bacterium]|nr:trypsin-like peptidase domain-containing protein [Candidatus Limnocylindrales bacterium]